MKKNLGKKLLAGGACACLLLTGGLTLSGCSLSGDQQKALDVLVSNTETLVKDFGSYLDNQNTKISKEKAVEIISRSRLNFIMGNFDHLQMKVSQNMFEGFEDKLDDSGTFERIYRSENGVKIIADIENEQFYSIKKSDFNNDIHYKWTKSDNFSEVEYSSAMWQLYYTDIFSQTPFNFIGEINEEDIYDVKLVDGGYEFEIVAEHSTITETDLSKYEEDDVVNIYNIIMNVEIKNNYITKVSYKGIATEVPINDLLKESNGENNTIVLNANGVPIVDSYDNAEIVTNITNVEYKYENIDYSVIDAKIAEIEEEHLTQN